MHRLIGPARRLARLAALMAGLALTGLPGGAGAETALCKGENLLAQLPPAKLADVDAATARQPFARGNLWRATRDGQVLHLLGTYHLPDLRHRALLPRIAQILTQSRILLVEAGPEQEQALRRELARNPAILLLPEGQSLKQRMSAEDWARLSQAAMRRNIPAVMATRLRPWYLAVALAVPPCSANPAAGAGLDAALASRARDAQIEIRALEPYDTVFRIFESVSEADQIAMLRTTLLLEPQAEDHARTLSDSYFAEDSRRLWEMLRIIAADMPGYDRARADAEYARLEDALMVKRNRAWIAGIEDAAAKGPTLAAFGALHLSGNEGVLNLLQQRGWQLERLPLAE